MTLYINISCLVITHRSSPPLLFVSDVEEQSVPSGLLKLSITVIILCVHLEISLNLTINTQQITLTTKVLCSRNHLINCIRKNSCIFKIWSDGDTELLLIIISNQLSSTLNNLLLFKEFKLFLSPEKLIKSKVIVVQRHLTIF